MPLLPEPPPILLSAVLAVGLVVGDCSRGAAGAGLVVIEPGGSQWQPSMVFVTAAYHCRNLFDCRGGIGVCGGLAQPAASASFEPAARLRVFGHRAAGSGSYAVLPGCARMGSACLGGKSDRLLAGFPRLACFHAARCGVPSCHRSIALPRIMLLSASLGQVVLVVYLQLFKAKEAGRRTWCYYNAALDARCGGGCTSSTACGLLWSERSFFWTISCSWISPSAE